MQYALLLILWTAFTVLHSLLISRGVTAWMRRKFGRYYAFYRLAYNILALITLLPPVLYSRSLDSRQVIYLSPPLEMASQFMLGASVLLMITALFHYDVLELSGIRQAIDFFRPSSRPGSRRNLSRAGLLGIVRHPMYLGAIVFFWARVTTPAEILVSLLLTAYMITGTIMEERKLVSEYGKAYIEYQKDVPMLLPSFKKMAMNKRKAL